MSIRYYDLDRPFTLSLFTDDQSHYIFATVTVSSANVGDTAVEILGDGIRLTVDGTLRATYGVKGDGGAFETVAVFGDTARVESSLEAVIFAGNAGLFSNAGEIESENRSALYVTGDGFRGANGGVMVAG